MSQVIFGTDRGIGHRKADGSTEVEVHAAPGLREVQVKLNGDNTYREALNTIAILWADRTEPGAVPLWVESENPLIAELLHSELGCPIGRPEGWELRHDPEPETDEDTTEIAAADVTSVPTEIAGVAPSSPEVTE